MITKTLSKNVQSIYFRPIIETKYEWYPSLPAYRSYRYRVFVIFPFRVPKIPAGWDVEDDSRYKDYYYGGGYVWGNRRKSSDSLVDDNHFMDGNKWYLKARVEVVYLEGTTRKVHTEYFIDDEIAKDYIKEIETNSGADMIIIK